MEELQKLMSENLIKLEKLLSNDLELNEEEQERKVNEILEGKF